MGLIWCFMPTCSISEDGKPNSTVDILPEAYHATALALTTRAKNSGAVQVGIGHTGLLKANHDSFIWTDSLQSCFPAVFKFKNGDIGLYHGYHTAIDDLSIFLEREDLNEIQIFEKGMELNTGKVKAFAQNLISHFRDRKQTPTINFLTQSDIAPYGAVICYKAPDGQPIILVGESGPHNELVKNQKECCNLEDSLRPCCFQSALDKYPFTPRGQSGFKEAMQTVREEGEEEDPVIKSSSCCRIS